MTRSLLFALMIFGFGLSANGQVTKYPLMEFSSANNLVITEIETKVNNNGKRLSSIKFELSPLQDQYLMIPKGMYVNDANDARNRYELKSISGANYQFNEWYLVEAGQLYNYTLNFEGFDPCVSSINIFEPKVPNTEPWVWKKIRVNNSCNGQRPYQNTVSTLPQNIPSNQPYSSKEKVIIGY